MKNTESNPDTTKTQMLDDLQKEMQTEMQKPLKQRNYNKISEIAETIRRLNDSEIDIQRNDEKNISDLCEKMRDNSKPKKHIKIYQLIVAISACLTLVFGGNIYTMKAYGDNLFSLIVNRTSSGFTVIFNGNNISSETPDIKDDPYGMIAKCAEYGVYPDTPLYIPDGFELVNFKVTEKKKSIDIKFNYIKDNITLTFFIDKYYNSNDIPNKSIPSDEHNISEIEVNGTKGITSKEKNSFNGITDQYELIYCKDNIIYIISSDGLDYDECDKITQSMTSNPLKGGEKNEEVVYNNVIINTVLPLYTNFDLCC